MHLAVFFCFFFFLNSGRTDDDFIAYCILLRCDYVKRPVRLGPKTVIKVIQMSFGASLDKTDAFDQVYRDVAYSFKCG